MIGRCQNPTNKDYDRYGGRGIKVCDEWLSFEAFKKDMWPRPSNDHSIGRIDNDKGYSPDNVRWETLDQQAVNKRSSRMIEYNGKIMCAADWARRIGVKRNAFYQRLKKMTAKDAIEFGGARKREA